MPLNSSIKHLAYLIDAECWRSYSGKPINYKRHMEGRRVRSLELATKVHRGDTMLNIDLGRNLAAPRSFVSTKMTPMKIAMMVHFYAVVGPFGPEETRRSDAYVQFVRELLHAGLIERPSREERGHHLGWAYRATDKGRVYVEALTRVPVPVAETRWIIPAPESQSSGCADGGFVRADRR